MKCQDWLVIASLGHRNIGTVVWCVIETLEQWCISEKGLNMEI